MQDSAALSRATAEMLQPESVESLIISEDESMNAYRRIQLSAAAVIANGALALSVLAPNPALATTCPGVAYTCDANCSFDWLTRCPSIKPAGCTRFVGHLCSSYNGCIAFGGILLTCYYQ